MNARTIPSSPQTRRELATGGVVSLLLHVVAVALLFLNLRLDMTPAAPKETAVEVVIVEAKPDAPPQPSPEPTKQAETAIPDLPVTERPPPPQLETAPLAERSSPPPGPARAGVRLRDGFDSAGPAPTPGPAAPPAPPAARAELSTGGGANVIASLPKPGSEGPAKQDEKDFLLAQILPFWLLNYRDPRYQHVVFRGYFTLRADGMLEPPFGKNDPWDPATMIGGYDALLARQQDSYRLAIESFLRAVRAAQPFRLNPSIDRNAYPRQVAVFFRLGDL
ncbi:MAG TPA: hypothetical protein VHM01_15345 [Alphaproteobacteria bacterium]|nr:hypothetical protein [Alphaproteobacteria bacterium]